LPTITLDGPKLTREQKATLVKEFTATAAKVTGISTQAFVVMLTEREQDNVGVGGVLLSERQQHS